MQLPRLPNCSYGIMDGQYIATQLTSSSHNSVGMADYEQGCRSELNFEQRMF